MKKMASLLKIIFQILVGGFLLAVLFFFLGSLCALPWIRDSLLFWFEQNLSPELCERFAYLGFGSPESSLIIVATALFTIFVIIPCIVAIICFVIWALAFGEINPPVEYNATYDQVSALEEKLDEMKNELGRQQVTNSYLEQEVADIHNLLDKMNKEKKRPI